MQNIVEDYPVAESNAQELASQVEDNTYSASNFIYKITQVLQSSKHLSGFLREKISQFLIERSKRTLLDKLFQNGFTFPIDKDLKSPATRVMFSNSNDIRQQICLKMWLECNNGVYDTGDLVRCTEYLLEGLKFNRRFASDICIGIVPIVSEYELEENVIQCGPLIRKPNGLKLDLNKPYALVMKRLDERWRLDHQLYTDGLGNEQGMKFLAREIACMHRQFVESPIDMGTPKRLSAKLQFNRQRFHEALDHVRKDQTHSDFRKLIGDEGIRWFRSVSWLLEQAGKIQHSNFESFEQRHNNRHIRRCHGDLKTTNLWIFQANNPRSHSQASDRRLVALDCVDFRPEFCHIDTLSDVAMLAIDLEMRLTGWSRDPQEQERGKELTQLFLDTYLHEMGEKETVRLLLEYYLTEKAMVCMYMSILYDNLPSLGEKYLHVVLTHSLKLADYLPPKIGKRITRPLALMTGGTTRHG
jgi:aminoglycoside phosphotransferase family enzyme